MIDQPLEESVPINDGSGTSPDNNSPPARTLSDDPNLTSSLPAMSEESTPPPVTSTSVPTIASEYVDYPPGSPVKLLGTGWVGATDTQPAETVTIVVNDTIGKTWKKTDTATPDANGDLTYEFTLPDYFVSDYDVTATGSIPYPDGTLRVATATFTDAQGAFSKPYAHWSDEPLPGDWNNNILNDNKSNYFEGEVIPHVWMYGASNNAPLVNGQSYSFNVTYNWYQQNTDAGGFAYMTQYNLSRQPNVFDWATPAVTPTADGAFTNGGGMKSGATSTRSTPTSPTSAPSPTPGTGTKDGVVTITFTYTGTTDQQRLRGDLLRPVHRQAGRGSQPGRRQDQRRQRLDRRLAADDRRHWRYRRNVDPARAGRDHPRRDQRPEVQRPERQRHQGRRRAGSRRLDDLPRQ